MQYIIFYVFYVMFTEEYFQLSRTEQQLRSSEILEDMSSIEKKIFYSDEKQLLAK